MAEKWSAHSGGRLTWLGVWLVLICQGCSSGDCLGSSHLTRVEEVDGALRYVGAMKDGQKHGQWITYDEGLLYEVKHYIDGKLHGPFRSYHENGALFSDGQFVRGILDGRHRVFRDNGQLLLLNWYNHGDRERTWCEWYPDGHLQRIAEYSADKLIREERDPPGTCPVTAGDGKRHLEYHDADDW